VKVTLKVLVADTNLAVAEVVACGARLAWPECQVSTVATGHEVLRRFRSERPDLVVLDVAMSRPDGFEVCRRIREASRVPVMVVSARDATVDKVRALDLGADDYLTKPFDDLELLARLRALVRRSNLSANQAPFTAGALSLDFETHEVRMWGRTVPLTATEYRLLEELVHHAGTVLPHALLLRQVWGPDDKPSTQCLKVFIRRLRRKLADDARCPTYIQSARGVGYRFALTSAADVSRCS
jgi:DNA-binding response OmpR family regulator